MIIPDSINVAVTYIQIRIESALTNIGGLIMDNQETKVCAKCGEERPISKFPYGARLSRGNICTICQYEAQKQRESKNKQFWLEDWIYN
jgi:hypothetical protein